MPSWLELFVFLSNVSLDFNLSNGPVCCPLGRLVVIPDSAVVWVCEARIYLA